MFLGSTVVRLLFLRETSEMFCHFLLPTKTKQPRPQGFSIAVPFSFVIFSIFLLFPFLSLQIIYQHKLLIVHALKNTI